MPLLLILTMLLSACETIDRNPAAELSQEMRCKAILTDLQVISWQGNNEARASELQKELKEGCL